jgi:FdhD protein
MFGDRTSEKIQDDMVSEQRVALYVNGVCEAVAILTPGEEDLWALGNLYCRRMIESMGDVTSLEVLPDKVIVERKSRNEGWAAETRFLHTASGAFLPKKHNTDARSQFLPVDWQISFTSIMAGIDWIAEAPLFRRTGSVHVAALISPAGEKLYRTEDVGRHNAVDKAIGWMLKNNVNPGQTALITSGRLPEDMVIKCLGARIPLMASISAATAQGADAAKAGHITLIGFARNGKFNVYSVQERIKQ